MNKVAYLSTRSHVGKVPRCIRNALPSPRRLFDDCQRQVGVPLVIQNVNREGGYVVGVFNVVGAVLENDLDNFRFLSTKELSWPDHIEVSSCKCSSILSRLLHIFVV
jgi:hypothetical protein